jgi:hypothetical protein
MASSLLATTLIAATTVAIALALVDYTTGLFTAASQPILRIPPDTTIDPEAGLLHLHIANQGTAAATIYRVEVRGLGATTTTIILPPGTTQSLDIPIPGATGATTGATYQVVVYTATSYTATGLAATAPGSASAATGRATASATGLLDLEITGAASLSATLTGTIAFQTEPGTILFTDTSTISYTDQDTILVKNTGQPLGQASQPSTIQVTVTSGAQHLQLTNIPAEEAYRDQALLATSKTIQRLTSGSAAACIPRKLYSLQLTPTITIEAEHAAVTITVDGNTVLESQDYTGTITVTITQAQPPTLIHYDPAQDTLTITGVQATVTTTQQ